MIIDGDTTVHSQMMWFLPANKAEHCKKQIDGSLCPYQDAR